MEQRKLIKQGPSSLSFTLPNKWIKENNLEKGDVVYFNIENNELLVNCEKKDCELKEKIILDDLDWVMSIHKLQSKYRIGATEIEVVSKKKDFIQIHNGNKKSFDELVHYTVSRFVGLEIVEQKKDSFILKQISSDNIDNFKTLLKRIFLLILKCLKDTELGINNSDYENLLLIKNQHDNINNLTNYCIRLISKNIDINKNKMISYFHLISQLDKIVDIFKYVSEDVIRNKIKVSDYFKKGYKLMSFNLELFYDLFYKFDNKKAFDFDKKRWDLKKYIFNNIKNLKKEELIILTRLEAINEILLDLTEIVMGLN